MIRKPATCEYGGENGKNLRTKDGFSSVFVKDVSRPFPDLQMNLLSRAFSNADQMSSSLHSLFGSRFSLTEPLNMVGF